MDSRLLLLQKEQELNQLREAALIELEQRYATKEQECHELQDKFNQLQADFEYNIQLLEGRDQELQQYDTDASLQAAALADSKRQLTELQEACEEAQKELKAEKAARQEEEFLAQTKCQELRQQIEDLRASAAEQLLRATEQYEHNKRVLQRALAEAEEEVSRQRREMGAEFQAQAQQLELKYRQQAEDAQQEAIVAKTLAQQRETEARAAHARELDRIKATEAALSVSRRHEQAAASLTWELESMQRLKDDAIAELQQQCTTLRQQLQVWTEEADQQHGDLSWRLASSITALEQVRASSAAAASQAEARHAEELAALRHKLQLAQCNVTSLETELSDAQAALLVMQQESREKAATLEQELRLKSESCEEVLAGAEQKHKAETRQLKESLWARDEEVQTLQEKLEGLKKVLAERRSDINTYKEQLVASGERERAIQRQLTAAEMRLEEAHEVQLASSATEQEGLTKRLLEQRNTANAALQDVQQRILAKEAEARYLRDHLAANIPPPKASVVLAAAAAVGAAAAIHSQPSHIASGANTPSRPHSHMPLSRDGGLQARQRQQQQQQLSRAEPRENALHQQGPSRLALTRPPQLAVQAQDAADAQPEGSQPAPSPSATPVDLNLLSPPSSAAFWAGVLGPDRSFDLNSAQGPGPTDNIFHPTNGRHSANNGQGAAAAPDNNGRDNSAAQAASAAAARAAAFLNSSREGIEGLLRSPNSPGRPLDRLEGTDGADVLLASPNAHTTALQAALSDVERQNMQLRATLGMMREEMETLQQAAAAAAAAVGNGGAPGTGEGGQDARGSSAADANQADAALDVALLRAELQESDNDLQQALHHVEVLQRQLYASAPSTSSSPFAPPATLQAKQQLQQLQQQGKDNEHDLVAEDSVSLHGEATASGRPAGESLQHMGRAASELQYLQGHVRELMLQNRTLRRQALHLKLALEQASSRSAPNQASPGAPHEMQDHTSTAPGAHGDEAQAIPQQQQQQQQQQQSGTGVDSKAELERAIRRIAQLQQENELLMDMSSALRAERDRLSMQLAALTASPSLPLPPSTPPHNSVPHWQPPAPSNQLMPTQTLPQTSGQQQTQLLQLHPGQSMQQYHPQPLPVQYPQQHPSGMISEGGASAAPGAPHAVLWPPSLPSQPPLLSQHHEHTAYDQQQGQPELQQPSQLQTQGLYEQQQDVLPLQHPSMGQPSAQRAAAAAAAAAAAGASSPRASRVVGGGADQASRIRNAPSQRSPPNASPPRQRALQQLVNPQAAPPGQPSSLNATGLAEGPFGSIQPLVAPSDGHPPPQQSPEQQEQQQQQRRQQPDQPVTAAPDGPHAPAQSGPTYMPASAVPGSASSRETASQRAKLRALQHRREAAATGGEAGAGPSMPRVRNYNVQSDNDWKAALRAMAVAGVAAPSVSTSVST